MLIHHQKVRRLAKSAMFQFALPTSLERILDECNRAFTDHDYEYALATIERVLKRYPERHDLRYLAGFHLEQLGRFAEARDYLEAAAPFSNNPDARVRLALAYRGENRFAEALEQLLLIKPETQSPLTRKLLIDTALNTPGGENLLRSKGIVTDESLWSFVALDEALGRPDNQILASLPDEDIHIKPIQVMGGASLDYEVGTAQSGTSYIGQLHDVTVMGNSDLVFDLKRKEIVSDIFKFGRNAIIDLSFNKAIEGHNENAAVVSWPQQNPIFLDKAISFLSATSNAYGHWFFEHLPRLEILLQAQIPTEIPLLIDEGLHPNHIEVLRRILGHDRPFIEIPHNGVVELNACIVLGARSFIPTITRSHHVTDFHDAPVSAQVLDFLRSHLKSGLSKKTKALYFARRKSTWRKLLNENEVIGLLQSKGFEIIDAENLTFKEVADLVAQARVVIGPLGSAMNNVTLAQPHTRALFLSPPSVSNYVSYLSALNDIGIEASFYCGTTEHSRTMKHANFSIPIKPFEKTVEQLLRSN